MKALGSVAVKATDFDVYVGGRLVGSVMTREKGWWMGLVHGVRRSRLYGKDFTSRAAAVRAVVEAIR